MSRSLRFLRFVLSVSVVATALLLFRSFPPVSTSAAPFEEANGAASMARGTPVTVLSGQGTLEQWQLAGGFLYWFHTCDTFLDETTAVLERRPVHGSTITELQNIDDEDECETFIGAAADDSGFYYYNRSSGYIEAIYSDSPGVPPEQLTFIGDRTEIGFGDAIGAVRLDDEYVYWIEVTPHGEFTPDDIVLKRVAKSGGATEELYSYEGYLASQEGLGVTSSYVWWTDGDGLHRIGKPGCTGDGCGPVLQRAFEMREGEIEVVNNALYWFDANPFANVRVRLHRTSCSALGGCITLPLYTAPAGASIYDVAAGGGFLYWPEAIPSVTTRLRRLPATGGDVDTVYEGSLTSVAVDADSQGVYFSNFERDSIFRLPHDADAITRRISIIGWEVTQGIQNLDNTVPLVAGKETYVRVYGTLDEGAVAGGVEARLHGSRDGVPLPGSPLFAINGTVPIEVATPMDRERDDGGWLFRLPREWTQEGNETIPLEDADLTLRVEVDPRGLSGDTSPGDNSLEGTFTFMAKAPTCVTMRPVETVNFYQSTRGISTGLTADLSETVMPTANLITFPKNDLLSEIDWCWKGIVYGPFCTTPYELSDDDSGLLTKMGFIDYFADIPDVCWVHNARTLFGGIVHASAPWDWAGLARVGNDQFLTKVPRYGSWSGPFSRKTGTAMTMVHEMGHNYGRRHVDCGNPANPDANYPYATDTLDDGTLTDPATHFGFDSWFLEPIRPDKNADFMSYCGPRWISDYTWKAMFNATRDPTWDTPFRREGEGPFEGVEHVVVAAGLVIPPDEGMLEPLWRYPAADASEALRAKWAEAIPAPWNPGGETPYHLQLLDAEGQIVADWEIALDSLSEVDAEQALPFTVVFPAPEESVAQVRLLNEETLLASLNPGEAIPTVNIIEPIGGDTVGQEVTVSWAATDPDGFVSLRYTIQYSPDMGEHWYPLAVDVAGNGGAASHSLILNLEGEEGSVEGTALVRVLASDGFNTGLDTSAPFTVARRPPEPVITSPFQGSTLPAGEAVTLRGRAFDPEDGLIVGEGLRWSGENVATAGDVAGVEGLAPGEHAVTLVATDSDSLSATTRITFTIAPLNVPTLPAGDLALDGFCDDPAYSGSPSLALAPYEDGNRATAFIGRTASNLVLCIMGLQGSEGRAGFFLDADNSRDPLVQSGDRGYFVRPDGTPSALQGNGGTLEPVRPEGLAARVSVSDATWNAELQLDAAVLEGWGRRAGLAIGHFDTVAPDNVWPATAEMLSPLSWAESNLGDVPRLTAVDPISATIGTTLTLAITGTGFTEESVALWEGSVISTTHVSSTLLQAEVPASLMGNAGGYELRVAPAPESELWSAPLSVELLNPVPAITSLTPASATMGAPGFLLAVRGANFVPGATILWNGEAQPTTYEDSTTLSASIGAEQLEAAHTIPVSVVNPDPSAGPATAVPFTIERDVDALYMPLFQQ